MMPSEVMGIPHISPVFRIRSECDTQNVEVTDIHLVQSQNSPFVIPLDNSHWWALLYASLVLSI